MDPALVRLLVEINRRFYAENAASFAATRRRIQPGVRRVLDGLPDDPGARWLDAGCGSGWLAVEWSKFGRQSRYLGVDFSAELLAEAAATAAAIAASAALAGGVPRVAFARADLSTPGWADGLEPGFAGALAFAVFHHLPSHGLRLSALREIHRLLAPGGLFYHSEWQFQHAPKLMERRVPWSAVGVDESALEQGDTLLDWQAPGPAAAQWLRYVHLFSREELDGLAAEAGFTILETFESDGAGGRLGLYQRWKKKD
jgi:SAM-dependent methyltransferase